jgi:CubicO group peptidase (beta-lactamase class C family)
VLFSPLGITQFEWAGNLAGVPSAASGLRLRPRDLAKFGSLYLHDGQWNTRQVVTVLSGRYNDFSQSPPQRLLREFIFPALPTVPASACPS